MDISTWHSVPLCSQVEEQNGKMYQLKVFELAPCDRQAGNYCTVVRRYMLTVGAQPLLLDHSQLHITTAICIVRPTRRPSQLELLLFSTTPFVLRRLRQCVLCCRRLLALSWQRI